MVRNMKDKKENCIMCSKKTKEKENTVIHKRKYYVSGAGQLCEECYKKIYSNKL